MAFNVNRWGRQTVTFNSGRIVLQDSANDNAPGFFTYATSVDTLTVTEAANYFSEVVFDLAVDDVIFIKASDQAEFVTVATVDREAGTITVTSGGGIGTVTVPDGGTGLTSLTPYAIMTGGTTSTGNMQQVAVGTAGQVLQSGGPAALPVYSTATFASTYASGTVLAATSLNTVVGLAYTSAATASTIVARDANGNTAANSFLEGFTTTATAAGTTVLTVASTRIQQFTGVTTQTVTLPVTSTLSLGQQYYIINDSSGVVTVQSSGANTIQAMAANTSLLLTVILTSGTTAASWQSSYLVDAGGGVSPGTANQLAYYQTTGNTLSGLASANNGVLVTSAGGVPSISSTTPTGLTIPAPRINQINDTNNLQVLNLLPVASAVNHVQIANGATGNAAQINAVGSDTNVGLTFQTQEAGGYNFATTLSTNAFTLSTGDLYQHTTTFTFANTSATRNVTWQDASGTVAYTSGAGWLTAPISGTTQNPAVVSTQYIALNSGQTTVTLPTTYAVGDTISLIGSAANTGGWIIQAAAGDTVRVLNSTTTAGGTITSSANAGSVITLVCDVANTSWVMTSGVYVTLTTA